MAKEKLRRTRSSKTEDISPSQPALFGIQYNLLDTDRASLYQARQLAYGFHCILRSYHHQGHCQYGKEQRSYAGEGRGIPPPLTMKQVVQIP